MIAYRFETLWRRWRRLGLARLLHYREHVERDLYSARPRLGSPAAVAPGGTLPTLRLDDVDPREAEAARLRVLLITVSLGAATLAILLGMLRLVLDGIASPVGWLLIGAAVALAAGPFLALVSRRLAGAWVPLVATVTLVLMAMFEGGLSSEALLWLGLLPVAASLFLGGAGALLVSVVAAMGLSSLLALHLVGTLDIADTGSGLALRFASALGAVAFGLLVGWSLDRGRKRAQTELLASRWRAHALLQAIPDALVLVDREGVVVGLADSDRGDRPLLGELAHGRPLLERVPGDVAPAVAEQMRRSHARSEVISREHASSQWDDERLVEVRSVPLSGGRGLLVVRDHSEVQRLRRLRDEFISNVGHELRTPLTSIQGVLRLLAGEAVDALPPQSRELLTVASRNTSRLGTLIDNLLDLRDIDTGGLPMSPATIDLVPVVRRSISQAALDHAGGIPVQLQAADDVPQVHLDAARLEQVVVELVTNALKYSSDSGEVRVTVSSYEEGARIAVSDDGPGIADSFRPQVFERFTQRDGSAARPVGGTGMGLYLAHRIVERLGGTIGFETESGVGTTFYVDLPAAPG